MNTVKHLTGLVALVFLISCGGGGEGGNSGAPATTGSSTANVTLEILSSRMYLSGSGNYYYIVGEIKNSSSVAVHYVQVIASMYNTGGNILKSDYTYTDISTIPPGGKSPFEIMTSYINGVASYKLQWQASQTTYVDPKLEVLSHNSYYSASGNYLYIDGEIRNNSTSTMNYAKIVATLYDSGGSVVTTDYTYSDIDSIPAGGTSPFSMMIDFWEGFSRYELLAE